MRENRFVRLQRKQVFSVLSLTIVIILVLLLVSKGSPDHSARAESSDGSAADIQPALQGPCAPWTAISACYPPFVAAEARFELRSGGTPIHSQLANPVVTRVRSSRVTLDEAVDDLPGFIMFDTVYVEGVGSPTMFNVTIYPDMGGVPDTLNPPICSFGPVPAVPGAPGAFSITTGPCLVPAGGWLSVVAFDAPWEWSAQAPLTGREMLVSASTPLPTDTPRPPTDTPRPATDTPAPPTDTRIPPTETRPPSATPTTPLVTSAQCVGNDLEITITAGDGPFNITATSAPPGASPILNVPVGVYTSPGPGSWTNVRVAETSDDFQVAPLGDFTCRADTDTPVPPTDTRIPPTDTPVRPTDTPRPPTDTPVPPTDTRIPPTDTPRPRSLTVTAACNGPDLEVTISSGDNPFDITASAGINTPVLGVGFGTTTIAGPEKWDNLTVQETTGDLESINLGQFKCRSDERPVPVSPAHRSRTTNPNPTFSWIGITDANNYRLFVFDDSNPSTRTVDIRENSGGPTTHTIITPIPEGRNFWRVRGRQHRIWSYWSIRFTLFVDPPPVVTEEVFDQ